ncbi:MAG: phage Gp37/Gp68 family protein [Armatimonadota bacterium]|nr:phage Gp37/Gp68 family protein [Armatimonadota bacterium]
MSTKSSIEWTESTWNPVTGCTKTSLGCRHCYAERMAYRLQSMGQPNYQNGFKVTTHENALDLPLKWKKPQIIFVNSMSDLFHEKVGNDFILRAFEVMRQAHWHRFQVLTKRAERMLEMNSILNWAPNIWMGVSIESEQWLHRADYLRETDAAVKFLSLEPLLGPLPNLNLDGIDWVIVGGESGPGARPLSDQWVKEIRDKCITSGAPFFFKQWGGVNKKKAGRLLEGRVWNQMPKQAVA